jgi:hypothetical protein
MALGPRATRACNLSIMREWWTPKTLRCKTAKQHSPANPTVVSARMAVASVSFTTRSQDATAAGLRRSRSFAERLLQRDVASLTLLSQMFLITSTQGLMKIHIDFKKHDSSSKLRVAIIGYLLLGLHELPPRSSGPPISFLSEQSWATSH